MSEQHFDIVIAGGGMVGASLALALRDFPGRVAVVDKRFAPVNTAPLDVRSTAINEGSRRFLATLGLWPALREVGAPIETIHVSDRGHFGAVRLCAHEYGLHALGYVLENHRLQETLSSALADSCNVSVIDAAVEEVTGAGDRLSVLADTSPITAKLLVIAAGGSALARRLGMQFSERAYGQAAIVANVLATRPQSGTAFERFTPSGPVALLPLGDSRYALVMTVEDETQQALLSCTDEEFLHHLQTAFGWRLGRFTRVGQRAAFPLSLIEAEQQVAPRCVLIGNAVRALHPVAGQGFNLALRDVVELAGLLTADGDRDPGASALLATFTERRRGDQRNTTYLTDLLVKTFGSPAAPLVAARNLGLLLHRMKPHLLQR